jgi:DNA-binding PadR family transcriptional regulator
MSRLHLMLLGFINNKPMYGYEILNTIAEKKMDIWIGIKPPSVYNALKILENKKYINGKQITEGNNPPRTVYEITTLGKNYLTKLIKINSRNFMEGHEFWFAISFSQLILTKKEFNQIVNERIDALKKHAMMDKDLFIRIEKEILDKKVPFIHKHLFKMGSTTHDLEIQVLTELLNDANNPENETFFLKEGK